MEYARALVRRSAPGYPAWNIERARQGAKKLAVDLARLYAARSQNGGFAFSKDTAWQKRLEEGFAPLRRGQPKAPSPVVPKGMEAYDHASG